MDVLDVKKTMLILLLTTLSFKEVKLDEESCQICTWNGWTNCLENLQKSIRILCCDNDVVSRLKADGNLSVRNCAEECIKMKKGNVSESDLNSLERTCICPDINLPEIIQFPETAVVGTAIYSSDIKVNSTDSRWEDRRAGVTITYKTTSSSYQLILNSDANLDEDLSNRCGVKNFNITFYCLEESVDVRFTVLDVNEIKAVFIKQEWRFITVKENAANGTILTTLKDRYTDRDCYSKYSFKIIPPLNAAPGETEDHFRLDAEDRLVLAKPFDAEELKCQQVSTLVKTIKIELWEEDSNQNNLQDTVTLTITITDLDDQEPMFVKPGCTNTCPDCLVSQYDVVITTSDSGLLNVSIQAIDTDTAGSNILYHIMKVEDIRYKDLFEMNETTGEVNLKQPFSDILTGTDIVDDFTVKLTIQGNENNTDQMSENITLLVMVIVPETTTEMVTTTELPTTVETTTEMVTTPTTTTSTSRPTIITTPSTPSPTQAADNSSGDNTTDILIIVIPVIAGILILVFILVYIVRYRRNKATLKRSYRLKHGQRNGYVDKEKSPSDGYDNVMKDSGNTDDRTVEVDNPEYQGTETEKGE